MPTKAPNGVPNTHLFTEHPRALFTPSASPSVGLPDHPSTKRPRLRSTPSSTVSATASTSNDSTSSAEVNSARRASTLRVLNVWAQLAERYNKRLDEDDIIDLYSGAIIRDRGVVSGASRDYHIGHFARTDDDQDADQDQEDSEQDDDDNELTAPPSEVVTDDDTPISKKELLRGVPPLSATTDAEDLEEFMEAEKKRKEVAGEEEEEDLSPEKLCAVREVLEKYAHEKEVLVAQLVQKAAEHAQKPEPDATPMRPVSRVPQSDEESEDELAVWTHDESTAVYPVGRDEPEQDVHEVEREVIDLTDSDSEEEFEKLLTLPPRPALTSRSSTPCSEAPPDHDRRRPESGAGSYSHGKLAKDTVEPESRSHSPLLSRKPEVIISHKRRPSVFKEPDSGTFNSGGPDQKAGRHISPARRGKGKGTVSKRTPNTPGTASRGRKRKRIASSSTVSESLAQSPELKGSPRIRAKSKSRALAEPDGLSPTLVTDLLTPAPPECTISGASCSLSSFSASKARLPTPAYTSVEPEAVRLTPDHHSSDIALLSDPPISVTLYPQRHVSRPPSIFTSPDQSTLTPGLSFPVHPPLPLDPAQAQQAHLLLAQAMHQLSYLMSAYATYSPNPGLPRNSPPPHDVYSTPTHPHFHGAHPYHTPSSSAPLSSPIQSSVPPPIEEQRYRSRGRSKSRGRRVSFRLGNEHDIQPEIYHSGQKNRKPPLEVKREKGKGKVIEKSPDASRLEDRVSPPHEVPRGRTPGPPSRKKIDTPRGRSLSRR